MVAAWLKGVVCGMVVATWLSGVVDVDVAGEDETGKDEIGAEETGEDSIGEVAIGVVAIDDDETGAVPAGVEELDVDGVGNGGTTEAGEEEGFGGLGTGDVPLGVEIDMGGETDLGGDTVFWLGEGETEVDDCWPGVQSKPTLWIPMLQLS